MSVLLNPSLHPELLKYDQLCAMHDYYWMAHEITQIELNFAKRFFDILDMYYTKKVSGLSQSVMEVQKLLKQTFEVEKAASLKELRAPINEKIRKRLIPLFWIDGLKYILPSQIEACVYHCTKHLQSELGEYESLVTGWQHTCYKNQDEYYEYVQNRVKFLTDKVRNLRESMNQARDYEHEFQKSTIPVRVMLRHSSMVSIESEEKVESDLIESHVGFDFPSKQQRVESICCERKEIVKNYIHDFVDSSDTDLDDAPASSRVTSFDESDDKNSVYGENGVERIRFYTELKEILVGMRDFKEINADTLRSVVLTVRIDPNLCLDALRNSLPEIKDKIYLGDTLLHFAVRQCYTQRKISKKISEYIIEQLTRFGANGFKKNSQGISPIRVVFENQDKALFDRIIEITDKQPFRYLITSKAQSILFKNSELREFVNKELYPFKDKLKQYAKRIREASEFPKNTECFIRMNESLYQIIDVFSTKLLSYNISQIQTDIDAPLFGRNQLWGIAKELKKQLSLLEQQDDKLRAAFADATRQEQEEAVEKICLQGRLNDEVKNDLSNKTKSSQNVTTTSYKETTCVVRYAQADDDIKRSQLKIAYNQLFKKSRDDKNELQEKLREVENKLVQEKNIREEMRKEFQKEMNELRNTVNQQIFPGQEACFPLQLQQKSSTYTSLKLGNEGEVISGEKIIGCSLL